MAERISCGRTGIGGVALGVGQSTARLQRRESILADFDERQQSGPERLSLS